MPEESPLQRLRRLEAEERSRAGTAPGARAGKAAAAGGGAMLALAKGKFAVLFLLGKLKFFFLAFKLLPVLGTLATMALSVQVYSSRYGWPLAAGLVGLILLHELGHGAAAKRLGLKVGAPVFIPFFGAVIALKEQPRSTWVECLVAGGGPAAGLLGAAACAAAAALRPDAPRAGFYLALAHLTATINLFNLLPAGNLDGDRITQPFRRAHWIAALAALTAVCAGASFAAGRLEAVALMILLVAGVKAWRRSRVAPRRLLDRLEEAGRYGAEERDTTPARRRAAALLYVGLAAALAALTAWAGRAAAPAREGASNLISFEPVKRLYLMRHGHAPSPADAGVKTDALRPLSEKGRRDARRMAEEIVKRGGKPALVLHSPLLRAVQTAQAAAAVLKTEALSFPPLDNTLPPDAALERLRARAGAADDVLAVGHQPQIGEIATLLTADIYEIRPAGIVAVEFGPEARLLWSSNVDELG
jgi:phosphohistidine phosphatase SixA